MIFYISLLAFFALLVMRKYLTPIPQHSSDILSYSHDQWDTATVPPSYPMYP